MIEALTTATEAAGLAIWAIRGLASGDGLTPPRVNSATARKRTLLTVLRLRARLIDGQIATVYRLALQCIDSSLAFTTISHGHKCKSTELTTHPIGWQVHVSDSAVSGEEV